MISEITICGMDFKVHYGRVNGASFSFFKREIVIGTKDKKKAFEYLVHEVVEIVLTHHDVRYHLTGRDDLYNHDILFAFTHNQFDLIATDIAFAIRQLEVPE